MTKPNNPDRSEPDEQGASDPAEAETAQSNPVEPDPAKPDPAVDSDTALSDDTRQAPAADDPWNHGLTNGSTAAVPPWQRAGVSMGDSGSPSVKLKVTKPEHGSGAKGTKADREPPVGGVQEARSASFTTPMTGSNRYGRPVAQPLSGQPSRAGSQEFSRPTVRIGGHVQPESVSPPSSMSTRVRPTRLPRRASLQLRYLEPWSVLKVSLILSVAGFLAWMVAVGVLYSVLAGMGVWDQLNGTYSDLTAVSDPKSSQQLISAGGVFGVAALIGLINIVLITAMCTVGAFIYNASADLAGGIEVTLAERD